MLLGIRLSVVVQMSIGLGVQPFAQGMPGCPFGKPIAADQINTIPSYDTDGEFFGLRRKIADLSLLHACVRAKGSHGPACRMRCAALAVFLCCQMKQAGWIEILTPTGVLATF